MRGIAGGGSILQLFEKCLKTRQPSTDQRITRTSMAKWPISKSWRIASKRGPPSRFSKFHNLGHFTQSTRTGGKPFHGKKLRACIMSDARIDPAESWRIDFGTPEKGRFSNFLISGYHEAMQRLGSISGVFEGSKRGKWQSILQLFADSAKRKGCKELPEGSKRVESL